MKTNLILIVFSLLILSCASENEQKALDEIANIYSAKTSYSKNFRSSMGNKSIKEFNVNVSNSIMLDTLPKDPAASNIAIIAYNNFNKEEKEKYSAINVALISKNNDTTKLSYPISILKDVAPKFKVFNDFSNDIIKENYSALDKYKDDEAMPKSVADFIQKNIADRENIFGTLENYKPVLIIDGGKKNIVQFVGLFLFKSGKSIVFYTVFDKTKGKDKIRGIHFLK